MVETLRYRGLLRRLRLLAYSQSAASIVLKSISLSTVSTVSRIPFVSIVSTKGIVEHRTEIAN
jgi:hypothetical protein